MGYRQTPAYPPPSSPLQQVMPGTTAQNYGGDVVRATPLETVMQTGKSAYALMERVHGLADRIAGPVSQDAKAQVDPPMPPGLLPSISAVAGLTQEVISRTQWALDRIEAAL